jgi:hypothetical protein
VTQPVTAFWKPERFGDYLERWIDQEHPDTALRQVVIDWTLARYDEPYKGGLERQPDQPNFYWGQIPGTIRHGSVVTCGYWICARTQGKVVTTDLDGRTKGYRLVTTTPGDSALTLSPGPVPTPRLGGGDHAAGPDAVPDHDPTPRERDDRDHHRETANPVAVDF